MSKFPLKKGGEGVVKIILNFKLQISKLNCKFQIENACPVGNL
jgi:hypothetical protein